VGGGWSQWFESLVCLDSSSESSGEERLVYRRFWSRGLQLIVARTSLLWVDQGWVDRTEGEAIAAGCGLWV
jgi:hypothetical protein